MWWCNVGYSSTEEVCSGPISAAVVLSLMLFSSLAMVEQMEENIGELKTGMIYTAPIQLQCMQKEWLESGQH